MMRQQGFFGAAMLPVSQLECTGISEIFSAPGSRFRNVMQKNRDAADRALLAGARFEVVEISDVASVLPL